MERIAKERIQDVKGNLSSVDKFKEEKTWNEKRNVHDRLKIISLSARSHLFFV